MYDMRSAEAFITGAYATVFWIGRKIAFASRWIYMWLTMLGRLKYNFPAEPLVRQPISSEVKITTK
jgi:hypothetical protein